MSMKEWRTGYTTGACAAAAAKAASLYLTQGTAVAEVEILLPGGRRVVIPVAYVRVGKNGVEAAVRKDGGDDPDVTHSALVIVSLMPAIGQEILLAAGEGVGTVTKPGLSVAPGEPAINPLPRQMIVGAIREVTPRGMLVTVSIPGGGKLAEKTFNPRLGIRGGLSILGTTGIVRPFSIDALRASVRCALDVAVACGVVAPVLVPGNIGRKAACRNFHLKEEQVIEGGNEWGFLIDTVAGYNFSELLVLGHPGKLVKLAAGQWDTHSARSASALTTVIIRAQILLGRPLTGHLTVEGLFSSLLPQEAGMLAKVLAEEIGNAVDERMGGSLHPSVALINMKGSILGNAGDLATWQ